MATSDFSKRVSFDTTIRYYKLRSHFFPFNSSFYKISFLFLIHIFSIPTFGQNIEKQDLTIEKIMQDPAQFIGTSPEAIKWAPDNRSIYFSWNPNKELISSPYQYNLHNGRTEKISDEARKELPQNGSFNKERTREVYVMRGNLFLMDIAKAQNELIISLPGSIESPVFSADGKRICFTYENNFFSWQIDGGKLKQYTNFIREESEKNSGTNDSKEAKWLHDQQMNLIAVLRESKAKRDAEKKEDSLMFPHSIKPIFTQNAVIFNCQINPVESYITYTQYTPVRQVPSTTIPEYVTESGYTETFKSRSKVGGATLTVDLYIYDIRKDTVYGIVIDSLPGIYDSPEYFKNYPGRDLKAKNKRKVFVTDPTWSGDGKYLVANIYAADNKDRWISLIDPVTGAIRPLERQHDSAWVDGPGIGEVFGGAVLGWLPDNKQIYFQSEASGYSHLYTLNVETGQKRQMTQGAFEVYDPLLSKDGKFWYFLANKTHPGVRHLYKLSVNGGEMVQLTSGDGGREFYLSPDEKWIALRFSTMNQPWELFLMENKLGAIPKQITYSQTNDFKAYPWRTPEVVSFPARDGAMVYARIYRPENPIASGPAILFVHGAGYLQNAHTWWSDYYHEYMFHNFLADKGYTVLDMDYRGSAGYGRDWRTGIYRHMGGNDLNDQVDGARYLVKEYGIDPSRIGIYGGSYGGFITLMAMFTQQETFKAGAALRAVTDWAHYNQSYTSNILNNPVDDSLAYVSSSPIYFAEGLKGPLLICHGMVDDNVHFQDVVRLSQRLIELGKDNWELAVYPMEHHTFTYSSSWTDEYKRIFKFFEENLNPGKK